jgi:RNA polymerase sigma-70 factor, ECF subfamily
VEAVPKHVTTLLRRFRAGNAQVAEELIPLLYEDLRRMASYYLRRERQDHTLQPTALVHETYLRLIDQKNAHWQNRSQSSRLQRD